MKATVILLAALALVACDDDVPAKSHSLAFAPALLLSPTPAFDARIVPGILPISRISTISCPFISAFTTAFDLIIVPEGRSTLFMDHVTFTLLDGSSVGGPTIPIPRPELNRMFGSTLIDGRRTFPFRPQFGCSVRRALSIVGDVRLVERSGATRNVRVTASF